MTRLSPPHRHIFLFDAAVIVCKRRGDNYEMKEVIDLHLFKITNNPTSEKETRKVGARARSHVGLDTADTLKEQRHKITQPRVNVRRSRRVCDVCAR